MFIVIAVVVVLVLGAVALLATARRRSATGRLSRETRRADASAPGDAAGAPTGTDADARARADETKASVDAGPGAPAAGHGGAALDEDALGVTRRQFFNRGILTGLGLGGGGFGAASLAFLWPATSAGFGGKVNIGSLDDIKKSLDAKQPYYNASAKVYVVPYPKADIDKAAQVYASTVVAGMEQGYVALYQKCPHLGCRVPWCQTSQWFECPCHGSKYNRVGEKTGGPAPRGMDRFPLEVSGASVVVDTGTIVQGPPIGVDTTGQGQEGAPCV